MQFGGDKGFSGAAFPFNRADTQVWNGALQLLEQAVNGGERPMMGAGRVAMAVLDAGLRLSKHCMLGGEEDAGNDAQEFAGGYRWSHDCEIYRQRRQKNQPKETGVLLALPFQESEADV